MKREPTLEAGFVLSRNRSEFDSVTPKSAAYTIPSFIRPMAKRSIERFATERGYATITETVMDEARTVYLIPSDMQLTLFEREVSKESLHQRLRSSIGTLLGLLQQRRVDRRRRERHQ